LSFTGLNGFDTNKIIPFEDFLDENEVAFTNFATLYTLVANFNSDETGGGGGITGFSTESTLLALNNKVPTLVGGKIPTTNPDSLPLPTGASTEATLSAINTKVPSKGQANSNGSTPVVIANDQSAIPTTPRANTSGTGGTTPYKLISVASTNANVVKASPGNLYSIIAIGVTSTVRYLKLYNKATMPTLTADVPIMTIPIPANTQGAGVCLPFSMGVNFSNGISIAITGNPSDNDATAIGAGDVIVNLTHA
jgi:hypothetical protein